MSSSTVFDSPPERTPPVRTAIAREAGPFRIRRVDYPPGLRQPPHAHQVASVTILLAGNIREITSAGEETGSSLSVVVKPPGVRHSDEVGPLGARTLQIAIQDPGLEMLRDAGADPCRWRWVHGGPAAASLLGLARWVARSPVPSIELEEMIMEAMGAVLPDEDPPGRTPPRWLLRVKDALEEEVSTHFSLSELGLLAGVHPVSLSRAFRRAFGVTITEHRRRVRLRRAASLVTEGEASLSRAAHAAGYADHPHMCRELRRATGLTPSELRRLAGS